MSVSASRLRGTCPRMGIISASEVGTPLRFHGGRKLTSKPRQLPPPQRMQAYKRQRQFLQWDGAHPQQRGSIS